jgi:hypothetical protein
VQIPVNSGTSLLAGTPPDPNAAASLGGGVVISTYNRPGSKPGSGRAGISYSINNGQPGTFTDIDISSQVPGEPSRTSFYPQSDGGVCCDQKVVYLPKQDLFVWVILYWPKTTCATNCGPPPASNATFKITQPNRLRVAWATPANIRANSATAFYDAWSYLDLTATNVPGVSTGLGVNNNEWLDYPDVAWSDMYLYVGIDHGKPRFGKIYPGVRIVARLLLADITNPTATVVNYSYSQLFDYNSLAKNHFVQGAPGHMVLAAVDNLSTLTVFTWDDQESSPGLVTGFPAQVPITPVNKRYNSPAPDNTDWVSVSPTGFINGAAYREVGFGTPSPEYLFAFDAGIDEGRGRPQHYVRVETLIPGTYVLGFKISDSGYTASSEYDIWNPDFAFAMAALGSDPSHVTPQIGMTVAIGGGTVGYPQATVGFKDDFVVYQVTASDATQISRFGDYFGTRFIPGAGSVLFATEVYDVKLNPGFGPTCAIVGCTAQMRYVEFGRPVGVNQ